MFARITCLLVAILTLTGCNMSDPLAYRIHDDEARIDKLYTYDADTVKRSGH